MVTYFESTWLYWLCLGQVSSRHGRTDAITVDALQSPMPTALFRRPVVLMRGRFILAPCRNGYRGILNGFLTLPDGHRDPNAYNTASCGAIYGVLDDVLSKAVLDNHPAAATLMVLYDQVRAIVGPEQSLALLTLDVPLRNDISGVQMSFQITECADLAIPGTWPVCVVPESIEEGGQDVAWP